MSNLDCMSGNGPVAVVTGSRRGIGLGIARALGRAGYRVFLSAVSDAGQAQDALDSLHGEGIHAEYVRCNIAKAEERAALIAAAERTGRFDLLVNNAGIAPRVRADILETSEESFEEVLGVNLEGAFFMCQAGARAMLRMLENPPENYHPRIVNVSSLSAYAASVNRGEYCISKAGVSMVTTLFASRLAEYGIPVFEVRPGIIAADMTAGVLDNYKRRIAEGLMPIPRVGTPEDVANCVLAAAGGLLDFATGQVLNADGGFHLRRL